MHLMNKNSHLFFFCTSTKHHTCSAGTLRRGFDPPKEMLKRLTVLVKFITKTKLLFNVLDKSITWKLGSQRSP